MLNINNNFPDAMATSYAWQDALIQTSYRKMAGPIPSHSLIQRI
jgi:hypothetical protein